MASTRKYQKPLFLTSEQIEQLAAIGCSDDEICALAGCSDRTLKIRHREELTRGRGRLRESLRRRQIERAMDGSDQMLIWLGKQYLMQRERSEQHLTVENWDVVIGKADATDGA